VKVLKWALVGSFAAIIAVIVFVKAGKGGGQSGGDQTATIIKSSSGGLASIATALEGG
jgi:hypothetical protein